MKRIKELPVTNKVTFPWSLSNSHNNLLKTIIQGKSREFSQQIRAQGLKGYQSSIQWQQSDS